MIGHRAPGVHVETAMHTESTRAITGWSAVAALVLLVTAGRLAYILWFCPYSLVEDEAYYWLWSRHLDWSYLTKGPGVALTIAAGTSLLGDTEAGIRLTTPIWGALLAVSAAGLAGDLVSPSDRPRARFWGAAVPLLCPPLQATALLMTIDGPMLASFAAGCWAAERGLHHRGTWAWLSLGVAVGVGLLFKPLVGLLPLGVGLFAAFCRGSLRLTEHPLPWVTLGGVLALAGLAPVLGWNLAHGWAMARHLAEHLHPENSGTGLSAGSLLARVGWVGEYLVVQVLLGGFVLAAAALAISRSVGRCDRSAHGPGVRLCVVLSALVYLLYLGVSLLTRVEGNWALAGLIPLLPVAGVWLVRASPWRTHLARAIVVAGLITGLGMLRLDLIARAPGVGPLVPIGRLTSGPILAAGIGGLLTELDGDSGPAFVITDHYGRAALLSFYLPDRWVGCSSGVVGGRVTQFDLWTDTRLDDPALVGRSASLLSGHLEDWALAFAVVEHRSSVGGDPRGQRVFLGRGYRGFPARPTPQVRASHGEGGPR